MRVSYIAAALGVPAALALTACSASDDGDVVDPVRETQGSPVERVAAQPASLPAPADGTGSDAIVPLASEPGPRGTMVDLQKADVTGDILTVQIGIRNGRANQSVPIEEISIIEDATAKRIGVLKDDGGQWLASPLQGARNERLFLKGEGDVAWIKFAAPDPSAQTISIGIPEVGSFDGIPVRR